MNINSINQNNISDFAYPVNIENKVEYSNDSIKMSLENQSNSTQEVDKNELDKNLAKLNRFLEDDKVHAEYSVHEVFNTVMIKIIDDKTKQVILEISPKKILDMIASMCKQFGILDKKA